MASRAGKRAVSLVPSITETLLTWGVEPVAVTRFCEAPGVPTVGGTKNPAVEAIIELAPDLVLMDREENRIEDATRLEAAGLNVVATHVTCLADVQPTLDLIAAELDLPAPTPLPSPDTARNGPRVWVPIWRRPWMTIGGHTYGSSLLQAAGFVNIYAASEESYPSIEPGQAAGLKPDYVLAPSEPYKFTERHRGELEVAAPAVFVDGQDLFWWGARTSAAWQRLSDLASSMVPR
jgi:ABC-type Fe3+-hydroxamate transport system substrate-binding protein